MASDAPSPHSPSLHLDLPAPQPLRRHHAQSLLGPSFHDPLTHHVLEITPSKPRLSPAATMSDAMLSALSGTPPLHCTSILQPATLLKLSLLSLRPLLLQFVSVLKVIVTLLLNSGAGSCSPTSKLSSYHYLLPTNTFSSHRFAFHTGP